MKNLFGNNCSKGCLIYLVALVAVLLLTSMGLGSLGSRFGAESQTAQISPLNVPNNQQANPVVQDQPASANTQASSQPSQVDPIIIQVVATPTAVTVVIQVQGGTISGEASNPFYIVQAGDTLWDIAQDYGITVDTLKSANSAISEIIKPGELVYLPQGGQVPAQPQAQEPPVQQQPAQPLQPAPATNQQPGGTLPTMPQTGINKKP